MNSLFKEDFLMNTNVEQQIYGTDVEYVYHNAYKQIEELENKLSFFIASSEIAKINEYAGKSAVSISKETMSILKTAAQFNSVSNGAFDITLAPIINLWRSYEKKGKIPNQNEITEKLKLCGMEYLELDEKNQSAYLKSEGSAIDLGGIAKGYTADMCLEYYKKMGIKKAFVNLGGNVKAMNTVTDKKWVVGLQDPEEERGICFAAMSISNHSIVTSGDYERCFKVNDKQYHHLIDGRTGYPVQKKLKSVSVVHDNSMIADALSTAIFVSGLTEGLDLVKIFPQAGVVIVGEDRQVYISENLKDHFHIIDEDQKYQFQFLNLEEVRR